jgi:hypothetical protein
VEGNFGRGYGPPRTVITEEEEEEEVYWNDSSVPGCKL